MYSSSVDILLNDEEKHQGYALACDEIEREKDRLADKQDILLRVETIHTVRIRVFRVNVTHNYWVLRPIIVVYFTIGIITLCRMWSMSWV